MSYFKIKNVIISVYRFLIFLCMFLLIITPLFLTGCTQTHKFTKNDSEPPIFVGEKAGEISEFILGPEDEVEISVWRHSDLNKTARIGPSGKLSYPLVGYIQASGLSIIQLRDIIQERLSKYFVDPKVTVAINSIRSQKIFVLGEVKNPGVFHIESSMTVLEAISNAGGLNLEANQESVLLIRGGLNKPELRSLNIKEILSKGTLNQNINLQRGDILYVSANFITNVDRFFKHLSTIISPIVSLESGIVLYPGVKDVLRGKEKESTIIVPSN